MDCPSTSPQNERYEQFVGLFARHQSAIFGYILSLLPTWADAEDVFQQTSLVLWRKFDEFDLADPASNFASWGCQIARYKALNHLKKHGRDRHVFSDDLVGLLADEGIEDTRRLEAQRRALAGCLGHLHARHRQLISLSYGGGTTIRQVAENLGRTPNSLYKVLNKIRAGLLRCIEKTLATGAEH
jgi:RNA polymerase sigma-70 factor, ECF subfamily